MKHQNMKCHKKFCNAIKCYYSLQTLYFLHEIEGKFCCYNRSNKNGPDCVFISPAGELMNYGENIPLPNYPMNEPTPDRLRVLAAFCKIKKKAFNRYNIVT